MQEALLAAAVSGRVDFDAPDTARWLTGAVRNHARMAARSSGRRRRRESQWSTDSATTPSSEPMDVPALLAALPPSLAAVAALVLSGHNRREVAWLLNLSDATLRQRITALRRGVVKAGFALPTDLPGLNLNLAYGRIRDALLPSLLRHGGVFASHDPDGHLFIVARAQERLLERPVRDTVKRAPDRPLQSLPPDEQRQE